MGGGSSVPKPDPYASQRQAEADKNVAWHENAINNPTQITPWGRQDYELRPGADPRNLRPGDYVMRQTLSPEMQAIYDQTLRTQQGLGGLQSDALERVRSGLAGDPSAGLGPAVTGSHIDTSGNAFSAERQRVEDALYRRHEGVLRDRFQQDDASRQARLAAMGFDPRSAGYQDAEGQAYKMQGLQYGDAMDRAILAGGQEQSRLLGDQLNATMTQSNLRGAGIQQNSALRQMPLNELNALLTQSTIDAPQFNPLRPVSVQGEDVLGQERMNLDAATAQRNQDVARRNATVTGLATIAGSMFGSPWVGAAVGAYMGSR